MIKHTFLYILFLRRSQIYVQIMKLITNCFGGQGRNLGGPKSILKWPS